MARIAGIRAELLSLLLEIHGELPASQVAESPSSCRIIATKEG